MQKNGKEIAWGHLVGLYYRDKGKATGLAIDNKLKLEHLQLTSFSKMRVDLAAQVHNKRQGCILANCAYCIIYIGFEWHC